MDRLNRTLTAVPGLRVGHATDAEAATGCTVVLGPFVAAAEIVGLATGTRELDALSPSHLVPSCDALLLTGGSAFGLGAADGVMRWLEERERGFATRAARVPIVPAAVIYDLAEGRADVRPGPGMGYAAADAAADGPVPEGRVGVGAGATVGKLRGGAGSEPGGVGSWADPGGEAVFPDPSAAGPDAREDGAPEPVAPEAAGAQASAEETAAPRPGGGSVPGTVAALAAVNAFGDVLDAEGRILAGCRDGEGGFVDTARVIREMAVEGELPGGSPGRAAEATTLAVVATDLPLTKVELGIVARGAATALHRRLSPAGSPFDGDLVFALSTGDPERRPRTPGPAEVLAVGLRASAALERALERAVTVGRPPRRAGDAASAGEEG